MKEIKLEKRKDIIEEMIKINKLCKNLKRIGFKAYIDFDIDNDRLILVIKNVKRNSFLHSYRI